MAAALSLAGLVAAGPVAATCVKTRPALPAIDPAAPAAARFAALTARTGWIDDANEDAAWRALVPELRRDPATPPAMLAASLAEYARTVTDNAAAEKLAEEAKAIADAHGLTDAPFYPRLLFSLSFRYMDAHHYAAAEALMPALMAATRRRFGEHSFEWAQANSAHGVLRNQQGRQDEAVDYELARRDAMLACLPDDDRRIGNMLMSYGATLSAAGRLDDAVTAEFRGIRWQIEHGGNSDEDGIRAYNNLGLLLRNVSRLAEAEALLREAARIGAERLPDAYGLRSSTLTALALTLSARGKQDEADATFARALDLHRQSKLPATSLGISGLYRRWGDVAQAKGDIPLTLQRRQIALDEMKAAPRTHPELARAQLEYASTLLLADRSAEANRLAGPAIATIRGGVAMIDGRRHASEIMYARIAGAADGPEAGYRALRPTVTLLEKLLLDQETGRGELVTYSPLLSPGFALFAKFALQTGRTDEAFHALQLASLSAIIVVTTDMAAREAIADPAGRKLVETLQDAVRTRRGLERERSNAIAAHAEVASIQARIDATDAGLAATVADLDRRVPAYRELGRPSPVALAQFQARLSPHQILLAPIPQHDGTFVIAVTRDGLAWGKSPANQLAVDRLVARLRGSIGDARRGGAKAVFDLAAARALYDVVVPAEIAPLLASHRSLLWYAPGKLATVPPGLLAAPTTAGAPPDWLIRSHDVTVLPTLGKPLSSETAATRSGGFVGVGDPSLAAPVALASRGFAFRDAAVETGAIKALPSLGNARGELDAMRAAVGGPGGVVLTGPAATETAVKALPRTHLAVLAFATHGLLAGDLPGLAEPALVLTPPAVTKGEDDGLLTASEIAGLRLDVDWVILSACNSASGGSGGSPEYAGLASAFVQAGARSLLVSHWPVRDDAAARLTVDTLREARTAPTRAIALQRATLRLMNDRSVPGAAHPAQWAPFVLVGQ